MNLTNRDRKLLWTRASNRCSYRSGDDFCRQPLTLTQDEGDVVVGEECHIVGEKPGAARYTADFDGRESYSNAILLCGTHHKLIDDPQTRHLYPGDVVRQMKAAHETAAANEEAPYKLRDSAFSTAVSDAETAIGLDVIGPGELSNVQSILTAENVRHVTGVRVRGPLIATLSFCESCGEPITAASVSTAPTSSTCPRCGHVKQVPR